MANEFRIEKEIELAATPGQVWDAITTAVGNETWLWSMPGDLRPEVPIVATWEQPEHLVVRMPAAEDGSVQAFEYVIEGRDGGTTVLRFVHSGVMGDTWEGEDPELTGRGWDMYLDTLSTMSSRRSWACGPPTRWSGSTMAAELRTASPRGRAVFSSEPGVWLPSFGGRDERRCSREPDVSLVTGPVLSGHDNLLFRRCTEALAWSSRPNQHSHDGYASWSMARYTP